MTVGRPLATRIHLSLALGAFLAACNFDPTASPISTLASRPSPETTVPRIDVAVTPLPSLTPPGTVADSRTPEATATPVPVLRQLTQGGCCTQPFWSPDGAQVWFIDKPAETQPGGIWGVSVTGGEPQFITDRLGLFSRDGSLVAYPQAGQTVIERLATGERWSVPASGRAIAFSPDDSQIAWQVASTSAGNFDRRLVEVWVANADGSQPRVVARLIGGGLGDWFPDGARLLVTGRETFDSDPMIASVNLADGVVTGLARGTNLRGAALSPEGGWVAYQVAFSGDTIADGLWVARTDGSEARELPTFGAYRWRREGQLVVIPLEPGAPSHRVLQIEAGTGEMIELTRPSQTPFRIAAGDWSLSPSGQHLVFVSGVDHNLWLLELP